MCDLCAESSIIHKEHFEILGIPHEELLKAIWKMVLGSIVASVTSLWHWLVASESSPYSVVDSCNYSHQLPRGLLQLPVILPG